jgi:hypothetical protein
MIKNKRNDKRGANDVRVSTKEGKIIRKKTLAKHHNT